MLLKKLCDHFAFASQSGECQPLVSIALLLCSDRGSLPYSIGHAGKLSWVWFRQPALGRRIREENT